MPLKLAAVKEPRFEVELPGGEVKEFDPWELSSQFERAIRLDATIDSQVAVVREAIGLPDLTRHQCMTVIAAVAEFVAGLDVSKKMRGLAPQN